MTGFPPTTTTGAQDCFPSSSGGLAKFTALPPRLLVGAARPRSISLLNPPTWGCPKRREKDLLSPRLGPGNKGTAKSFGLGKGAESCLDKQQFAWGY